MIYISIAITLIYTLLIINFLRGFHKIKLYSADNISFKSNFSIVIPFRNEEKNLPDLLASISQLKYPRDKFEVILVNDESNDNFQQIIDDFLSNTDIILHLIGNKRKSNSPKKDAIDTAIYRSNFEWIITSDADCFFPINWLKTIDNFIQKKSPKMIVAPVSFVGQDSFLDTFQVLDLLSLQGCTIGGFGINKPFLCNGANLCYKKEAFKNVNGFVGNENIASGDDIFLLEKMINAYPSGVNYLKSQEAIVTTKPEKTLSSLIEQRIRWASKTSSYKNNFGKFVGLTVFIMNLWLIILLLSTFSNSISWQHFGFVFILKFNLDFLIIYHSATFFKQQNSLRKYVFSSLLYPFFIVFVALLSFRKTYTWKERSFSK